MFNNSRTGGRKRWRWGRKAGGSRDEDSSRNKTLDCLHYDEEGEVESVPDHALLGPLGFRPGKKVRVLTRARFGGPIMADIEGRHTAPGLSIARQIRLCNCRRCSKKDGRGHSDR